MFIYSFTYWETPSQGKTRAKRSALFGAPSGWVNIFLGPNWPGVFGQFVPVCALRIFK
jgi:hypothetical protein